MPGISRDRPLSLLLFFSPSSSFLSSSLLFPPSYTLPLYPLVSPIIYPLSPCIQVTGVLPPSTVPSRFSPYPSTAGDPPAGYSPSSSPHRRPPSHTGLSGVVVLLESHRFWSKCPGRARSAASEERPHWKKHGQTPRPTAYDLDFYNQVGSAFVSGFRCCCYFTLLLLSGSPRLV